ncbi:hypothetical protein NLX86_32550 [Streptomyces sp. A3M-1-3]|uniref:CorA family divalent cation transporter n=1 Tax=Streptomyces sp. A3M-1-3 TaxID=2962044 RepID=UPI0020B876BA|nr:CorA family divalent cation transporter [Streptomyces sp. A3M-1-3]MCP3822645.1 hypothetical protein [Streptomyces sp. A3M-1-3]
MVPLLQPLRDLAERRVPGVDKDIARYTRDVHDHLTQAAERLTALAVPIGIVGIYGMNCGHMPELGWTLGYPLVLVGIVVVCAVIYRALRRNGWL